MIKDWIETYAPKSSADYKQAFREIMQQIALAGLARGGFFRQAAFYGGTALKIFYRLDRFSEDIDFSLLKEDREFSLENYLNFIEDEFLSQGLQVSIKIKKKPVNSAIESAFLKSDTIWSELVLESAVPEVNLRQMVGLKIKIEVDTLPPLGFGTEEKLLLRPYSFYVKCFKLEDLFAGKMHALLFRKWKNNIKGRDWYDMEWYIRRGTTLNLPHFISRAKATGDWKKETMTKDELKKLLKQRIEEVDIEIAKRDISRFISNQHVLNIWSKKYFHDLIKQLEIV